MAVFLMAVSFTFGCSKSEPTTSRDVQPGPLLAATMPPPAPAPTAVAIAAPHRPTAAERFVEIDRLLARPLTGTPEQADERSLLRAERAALISSGQVPYQPVNQSSSVQHPGDGDASDHPPVPVDPPRGQIVVAETSSLPFLEQMTPTERDHYFQELWLQNGSFVDVNYSGWGFGRTGLNRKRPHMRPRR